MMTLKQISYISGFSTSTVSKALNNRLDINVETRKQIQDIALKNNYVPNKNAIALRKRKSNSIAVILPQVNHKQYSDTLYEIQKSASSMGFRVLLFQSFEDNLKEIEFLEEIKDGSVDAAILISTNADFTTEKFNPIPIEYIHIIKDQTPENLSMFSVKRFEKLLETI